MNRRSAAYLYGRGVADDKGELYTLVAAARQLSRAGQLPVNVRFACDGEEETGGQSIVEYLEADTRGADAAVIFDGGMIRRELPAFIVGTRGIVYFHVELRSGERDLHSGVYGGAALNAANALIRTLDALIARNGRVVEPLREGIVMPTEEEMASGSAWEELTRRMLDGDLSMPPIHARPRSSTCGRAPSRRSTSMGSRAAPPGWSRPSCRSPPRRTSRSGWPPARRSRGSPRRSSGSFARSRPRGLSSPSS